MAKQFRIYIEETSTRLFSRVVTAETREAAEAIAQGALDDDTWTDWETSDSDASLEVRAELTAIVNARGKETRLS